MDETKIDNNGHADQDELEETEDYEGAWQKLSELSRKDNSLITFGKTEMSLMQKILSTGSEAYR